MRVLVTYFSQTGNTEKVAEAIFNGIEGEKEIRPMSEVESLDGYDLAFVGFPMHGGQPAGEAKAFLEQNSNGRRLALFTTHAAPEDWPGIAEAKHACKAAAAGADVVGMFDCRGELSEFIADLMAKSGDPGLVEAAERRAETAGQPDEERLERARAFGARIVARYGGG